MNSMISVISVIIWRIPVEQWTSCSSNSAVRISFMDELGPSGLTALRKKFYIDIKKQGLEIQKQQAERDVSVHLTLSLSEGHDYHRIPRQLFGDRVVVAG